MSPILAKQLHNQLKQVFSKPFAIVDKDGQAIGGANDLTKLSVIRFSEGISQAKDTVRIEGHDHLLGLPIYWEGNFFAVVVTEIAVEDIQTIQIIISMAQLVVQQFISANKPRPDAVDLLLTRLAYRPETIDEDELEQQMAALGYRLDVQRTVVVFELTGFWDNYLHTAGEPLGEKDSLIASKKRDIELGLRSFFTKNPDNVVGYVGKDTFIVLKDLSTTDYERFCRLVTTHYRDITDSLKNVYITDVSIGIGSPANSPGELVGSAKEAQQVLQIGQNLNSQSHVYRIGELGVLPLLVSSSPKQKRDYADKVLAGLDSELTETLETFLGDSLNLTKTAENLKVHRNTVIYRLDKITEKINRDPRQFSDAVELHLALLFRRVFGDKQKT
ncbi:MAG: helix-turn-helix domain-containing protein [Patescibacteria group bacterium]